MRINETNGNCNESEGKRNIKTKRKESRNDVNLASEKYYKLRYEACKNSNGQGERGIHYDTIPDKMYCHSDILPRHAFSYII